MGKTSTKLTQRHLAKVLKPGPPKQISHEVEDKFEEMGLDNSILGDLNEWLLAIEELGLGNWTITEIYEAFNSLLNKRHENQRKSIKRV